MSDDAVLRLCDVNAGYGRTAVLRDVSISVPPHGVVALLGPNGAGKTTTLRVAAGLIHPTSGTVMLRGDDATQLPPHRRAARGLCLIPEGRGIFPRLTVRENLRLQLPPRSDAGTIDSALTAFPILKDRLGQLAGTLSGGQQQMLALSRAYVTNPSLVILDEVSMGLAPLVVDEIFESLDALAKSGAALLIVEQYIPRALALADEVVVLDRGRVSYSGPRSSLDETELMRAYLDHRPLAEDAPPAQ
jgi:branched-chain amino acid transport system ATP-binding protein